MGPDRSLSATRARARRSLGALAVLLAGSTLAFLLIFTPGVLREWQGRAAWEAGASPMEQLRRHGGVALQAQAALLAGLYPQGLVASLQASDWAVTRHVFDEPPPVHAAVLAPGGARVVTTDGTRFFDWRLPQPGLVALHGPHSAAAASAPRETGWGFGRVAFTGRGEEVVALATRGRTALWWLGEGARAPWPVDGPEAEGVDGLVAHQGTVVLWNSFGAGLRWLRPGAAQSQGLPHEEVAVATFTADGTLVSASRTLLRRWRDGRQVSEQPLALAYNPLALADDGAHVMALHDERTLAVVDTREPTASPGAMSSTSAKPSTPLAPRLLPHDQAVSAVCACEGLVVTGTTDGVLRVWQATVSAGEGEVPRPLREWAAYPGRVALLACRGQRLVSVGSSGWAQDHALLWDLLGQAQPPEARVIAPRVWPPSWPVQGLLASGLDPTATAALVEPLFDALEPWAAQVGLGVWTATLLGAGALWRRRRE